MRASSRRDGAFSDGTHGLKLAANIHDLGKISIPSELLTKPGRLSKPEFDLIKEHAELGYEIIKKVHFPWPIADMVRQHHERLDDSGYPLGLRDEAILLESKILALADVVEAMGPRTGLIDQPVGLTPLWTRSLPAAGQDSIRRLWMFVSVFSAKRATVFQPDAQQCRLQLDTKSRPSVIVSRTD